MEIVQAQETAGMLCQHMNGSLPKLEATCNCTKFHTARILADISELIGIHFKHHPYYSSKLNLHANVSKIPSSVGQVAFELPKKKKLTPFLQSLTSLPN